MYCVQFILMFILTKSQVSPIWEPTSKVISGYFYPLSPPVNIGNQYNYLVIYNPAPTFTNPYLMLSMSKLTINSISFIYLKITANSFTDTSFNCRIDFGQNTTIFNLKVKYFAYEGALNEFNFISIGFKNIQNQNLTATNVIANVFQWLTLDPNHQYVYSAFLTGVSARFPVLLSLKLSLERNNNQIDMMVSIENNTELIMITFYALIADQTSLEANSLAFVENYITYTQNGIQKIFFQQKQFYDQNNYCSGLLSLSIPASLQYEFAISGLNFTTSSNSPYTSSSHFNVWVRKCPTSQPYFNKIDQMCFNLCPAQTYDTFFETQLCQPCDSSCLTCQNPTQCLSCDNSKHRILVNKTCECKQNLKQNNKTCYSQCGDSYLLDQQCDDGNNLTDDGCNSNCSIQQGYICDNTTNISICYWMDFMIQLHTYSNISLSQDNGILFYLDVIPYSKSFMNFLVANPHNLLINDIPALSITKINNQTLVILIKFNTTWNGGNVIVQIFPAQNGTFMNFDVLQQVFWVDGQPDNTTNTNSTNNTDSMNNTDNNTNENETNSTENNSTMNSTDNNENVTNNDTDNSTNNTSSDNSTNMTDNGTTATNGTNHETGNDTSNNNSNYTNTTTDDVQILVPTSPSVSSANSVLQLVVPCCLLLLALLFCYKDSKQRGIQLFLSIQSTYISFLIQPQLPNTIIQYPSIRYVMGWNELVQGANQDSIPYASFEGMKYHTAFHENLNFMFIFPMVCIILLCINKLCLHLNKQESPKITFMNKVSSQFKSDMVIYWILIIMQQIIISAFLQILQLSNIPAIVIMVFGIILTIAGLVMLFLLPQIPTYRKNLYKKSSKLNPLGFMIASTLLLLLFILLGLAVSIYVFYLSIIPPLFIIVYVMVVKPFTLAIDNARIIVLESGVVLAFSGQIASMYFQNYQEIFTYVTLSSMAISILFTLSIWLYLLLCPSVPQASPLQLEWQQFVQSSKIRQTQYSALTLNTTPRLTNLNQSSHIKNKILNKSIRNRLEQFKIKTTDRCNRQMLLNETKENVNENGEKEEKKPGLKSQEDEDSKDGGNLVDYQEI